MTVIREAKTQAEIESCWETMFQLRPHLIQSEFSSRVQAQMDLNGYRLLYIVDEEAGTGEVPGALLGFRIEHKLYTGKTLYIDDFCTLSRVQKKGYGGKLLDWVKAYAVEEGCDLVTLDSGFSRHDAHRLYLNKGFVLGCHHFTMKLK